MGISLPAYNYPPARPGDGVWGPVTSTINWCEEDYYATIYSAEIVNTLTNILFIILGVKGLRNCIKYKHDNVFAVAFSGYMLVGIGSFAFHTTLKCMNSTLKIKFLQRCDLIHATDSMQLVDELSMIYTTCIMCYATFSYEKSRLYRQLLGFYPTFHQNAFAVLITIVLLRSMYIMEFEVRPSMQKIHSADMKNKVVKGTIPSGVWRKTSDLSIVNEMWLMVSLGLSIFLAGFGIWALDNVYCSTLLRWRHEIGLPWGLLLEGHGWWHLMTGVGSYFYLTWGVWLRYCLMRQHNKFVLYWPSVFFSLPEVLPLLVAEKKATHKKHLETMKDRSQKFVNKNSDDNKKSS
ncbi:Bgt-991 [Blumeria graminis f. sp. tritici]|uniref:Alkaline ceramidase n=2 Tax=Blumeria graminis f. sp. tritici TaxID=62690 RepID=A0A061HGC4_BLUGR|nr:Alkaline ceramidase [Blumeria graminis f. sp. tritici 96224]VDB89715.1 Bgt-991 [Blumeria graminis f. sp. tritici]